jgi:hypothetical protein
MSSSSFPLVANQLLIPIDGTAALPSLAFGGSPGSNSGTGMYGTYGSIKHTLNGTLALTLDTTALTLAAGYISLAGTLLMTGAGVPTNGTTGLNVAGKGSLYIDTTNGKLYITTAASSNPTWIVVGTQT